MFCVFGVFVCTYKVRRAGLRPNPALGGAATHADVAILRVRWFVCVWSAAVCVQDAVRVADRAAVPVPGVRSAGVPSHQARLLRQPTREGAGATFAQHARPPTRHDVQHTSHAPRCPHSSHTAWDGIGIIDRARRCALRRCGQVPELSAFILITFFPQIPIVVLLGILQVPALPVELIMSLPLALLLVRGTTVLCGVSAGRTHGVHTRLRRCVRWC